MIFLILCKGQNVPKIVTSKLNFCHMKEKQMEKQKTVMTFQSEMVLHLSQSEVNLVVH